MLLLPFAFPCMSLMKMDENLASGRSSVISVLAGKKKFFAIVDVVVPEGL